MKKIKVLLSPTVTTAQCCDPRFIKLWSEAERFFNNPREFTPEFRLHLCLHEAGHTIYARALGASVKFHGPTMYWDSRPQYDKPMISKSATTWLRPETTDVTAVIKADIGGFVFREILTNDPNDQIAVESDIDGARRWYAQHVGLGGFAFEATVGMARDEIIEDLRSPGFRKLAWDTAREFERAVFGV